MKHQKLLKRIPGMFVLAILLCASLLAQTPTAEQAPANQPFTPGVTVDSARKSGELGAAQTTEGNPGVTLGEYEVKQTIEFGGRITDFSGNQDVQQTFVNLQDGPRLLEYTLDMKSPNHTGVLFDDLFLSNFGYGGDPNNVSLLRMRKGDLYSLSGTFRRDKNFFDYDLLANPLNPSNSNPSVPIFFSPHSMFSLTRRMTDVSLQLLNRKPIGFRLGYSRVNNEGTTLSTIHEGTDGLLTQPWRYTQDRYQVGVTIRAIPHTSINYDQFYSFLKNDTTAGLAAFPVGSGLNTLANGSTVFLGLPFNTLAGQPCASPVLSTGFVNPACNGLFNYSRFGDTRTSLPTEQLSLQSEPFRRLNITGVATYSNAKDKLPTFAEIFNGLITRNRARIVVQAGTPGSPEATLTHRISGTADFGATLRLTDRLRLVDKFHFENWRIPSLWDYTTVSAFGATLLSTPNVFSPATCPPPFTAATCPQHSASSGADVTVDVLSNFLKQDWKSNLFEVEYDFTRKVTGYIGYRFDRRRIIHTFNDVQAQTFFPTLPNRGNCAGQPLDANGICTVLVPSDANGTDDIPIDSHSAVAGFSARPIEGLRISFDTELMYADNFFTRVAPRHLQLYRLRSTYRAKEWLNLGANFNIRESRNTTADIGHKDHDRSYGFLAAVGKPTYGVDLSYDYNDVFSTTNVCFVATPSPPVVTSCGTPFLAAPSVYTEAVHNASGSFYVQPFKRLTASAGYTVTVSNGSSLLLNPIAPPGPLAYTYHLPVASLAIGIFKNTTFKAGWNYYDYNEKSSTIGPTLPRDFRGNVATLSIRYTM